MKQTKYSQRKKRRSESKRLLEQVNENRASVLIIHYSCESFYKINDGRTPRITSIAVRNFESGQTHSFSIHKCAEESKVELSNMQKEYDVLEKKMLDQYFEYISKHENSKFIHWNMRDINYGFQAIEHRYKVLQGTPIAINEANKTDLARLLIGLFGIKYISHGEHGRLHELLKLNKMTMKDILTGQEESDAFDNSEYIKLHQSTLRKVDAFANILERTLDGSLKTHAKWKDIYGFNLNKIMSWIRGHWIISIIAIIGSIAGVIKLIQFIYSNIFQ